MTKELTVAREAYKLLKDVPAKNWIVSEYTDGKGQCCILGHYSRLKSNQPDNYSTLNCMSHEHVLRHASIEFFTKFHDLDYMADVASVNNRPNVNGYTQKSIKARGMALLKDMIKAGY